jgi:hypothetical protein
VRGIDLLVQIREETPGPPEECAAVVATVE